MEGCGLPAAPPCGLCFTQATCAALRFSHPRALGVSVVSVTLDKSRLAETHLTTHDVKNEDARAVVAIEHATRCLDNLAVTRLSHLRRTGTALGLFHKLLNVLEDSLNKTPRRLRVIESDVIGNGVEFMESRFSPD